MRKRNGSIYQAHLAQQTHPLTSDRVARLAQYLREHAADYGRLQNSPHDGAHHGAQGAADAGIGGLWGSMEWFGTIERALRELLQVHVAALYGSAY